MLAGHWGWFPLENKSKGKQTKPISAETWPTFKLLSGEESPPDFNYPLILWRAGGKWQQLGNTLFQPSDTGKHILCGGLSTEL